MLKTIYLFHGYAPMDGVSLAKKLQRMAKRGWHLAKYSYGYLRFEKGESIDAAYAVTYLPEANEYDPKRPEAQEVYIAMCEESGWELVTVYGSMHVFRHADPNAIPIETDEGLRLQMIERVTVPGYIKSELSLSILPLLPLLLFSAVFFSDPAALLANKLFLLAFTALIGSFIRGPLEVLWYYIWRKISRKRVINGAPCLPPYTRQRRIVSFFLKLPMCLLILYLLSAVRPRYMVWGILLMLGLFSGLLILLDTYLLKRSKEKHERDIYVKKYYLHTRFVLLLIVFAALRGLPLSNVTLELALHDVNIDTKAQLPVTLDALDLLDPAIEYTYTGQLNQTFLATHHSFTHAPAAYDYSQPQIEYSIYRIPFTPLHRISLDALDTHLHSLYNYGALDPAALQLDADSISYCTNHDKDRAFYLIAFGDHIIDLQLPAKLTMEQKTNIIRTLMTYAVREV